MSDVGTTIRLLLRDQMGGRLDSIKNDTKLVKDLGCDSLDIVEITMALEEEFNFEIPDDEAEKLETVKQVINYVEKKKKEKREVDVFSRSVR